MTRNEQILSEVQKRFSSNDTHLVSKISTFIDGAKRADEHPNTEDYANLIKDKIMTQDKHRYNISEATDMLNLCNQCWKKIDFLTEIKSMYGNLKISEIIESLEYQANKFNKRFQDLIKID